MNVVARNTAAAFGCCKHGLRLRHDVCDACQRELREAAEADQECREQHPHGTSTFRFAAEYR